MLSYRVAYEVLSSSVYPENGNHVRSHAVVKIKYKHMMLSCIVA